MDQLPEVHVVAGALFDAEGRVLIAQRPRGRHMAGRWEFPGGKLAAGEEPLAGLRRELAEELGLEVRSARRLIRLRHDYPNRRVLLDVWQVTDYAGTPRGLDSQALNWAAPDALPAHDMLEADRPIVTALRLPQRARRLAELPLPARYRPPVSETILWRASAEANPPARGDDVRALRARGHRVLVMGEGIQAIQAAVLASADGAVLTWHGRNLDIDRRGHFLLGFCCADAVAAQAAAEGGAHFVIVAPASGPLPERELARLCEELGVPVFSGWYPDARRLGRLQMAGAHGCAIDAPAG